MQLLASLATLIRKCSRQALRPFVVTCMPLLCVLVLPWAVANGQTTTFVPYFPKYQVLGVVYAPPGSASSVTYGNSEMVGSSNSLQSNFNQAYSLSVSVQAEAGFFGFGSASAGGSVSYGWADQTSQTNTVAIQTTTGNAVATAGPVSSALGVNHDNDIIYILLNPVVATTTSGLTSSGFVWNGIQSNSCDLTDSEFVTNGYNVYQAVGGCDPNQYPFPDIVGIPVWCLKNPYYPAPSCAQWLPYTSRSWDTTNWGNDPLTGLPLGPMLTLHDYADILSSDPFVTQTLVPVNQTANYLCHQNTAGQGAYGVNLDPNDAELAVVATPPTISPYTAGVVACQSAGGSYNAAPCTFSTSAACTAVGGTWASNACTFTAQSCTAAGGVSFASGACTMPSKYCSTYGGTATTMSCSWPTNFCGTPASGSTTIAMQRFDPYDTVQYPEPGINGEPQTYSGSIGYQATTTLGQSSQTTSTTGLGVNFAVTIGPCALFGCLKIDFNENNTWTWGQETNSLNSNEKSSTAGYSITGPQLTDNYLGPTTFNVYKDNVFGTFSFYSDLQRENPPLELSYSSTATTVPPSGLMNSQPPITTGFSGLNNPAVPAFSATTAASYAFTTSEPVATTTPATVWVQVTNNSPNWMTLPGPAITFSDPGFQIVNPANNSTSNTDSCSNQLLAPVGTMSNSPFTGTVPAVNPNTDIYTYYCFVEIQFDPVVSDAPNSLLASYPVASSLVAAGTENITSYQNILVSTTGSMVSGTATPSTTKTGATLFPATIQTPGVNFYNFGSVTASSTPEGFTFTNLGTSAMYITNILLTDTTDYNVTSSTCTVNSNGTASSNGSTKQIAAGSTCTFTLNYAPVNGGTVLTGITVMGTVAGGTSVPGALAGAGAQGTSASSPTFTVGGPITAQYTANGNSISLGGSITITNTSTRAINVTGEGYNDGSSGPTVTEGSCTSVAAGASCSLSANLTWTLPVIPIAPCPASTASFGIPFAVQFTGSSSGGSGGAGTFNITLCGESSPGFVARISGAEKSTTVAVPATAATGTVTVQQATTTTASHSTSASASPAAGPAPVTPPTGPAKLSLAVKVGSFQTTVQTPAGSTAAVIAQAIARALNVLTSPVRATASGAVVSLTSYTKGSAANLALSVTGNQDYAVLTSGSALTGGNNATTTTKYDAGVVTLKTNGVTASATWGQNSTAATVAQALAASVNQLASAYWSASSNAGVIILNPVSTSSATHSTSATQTVPSMSVSDSEGFTTASYAIEVN